MYDVGICRFPRPPVPENDDDNWGARKQTTRWRDIIESMSKMNEACRTKDEHMTTKETDHAKAWMLGGEDTSEDTSKFIVVRGLMAAHRFGWTTRACQNDYVIFEFHKHGTQLWLDAWGVAYVIIILLCFSLLSLRIRPLPALSRCSSFHHGTSFFRICCSSQTFTQVPFSLGLVLSVRSPSNVSTRTSQGTYRIVSHHLVHVFSHSSRRRFRFLVLFLSYYIFTHY